MKNFRLILFVTLLFCGLYTSVNDSFLQYKNSSSFKEGPDSISSTCYIMNDKCTLLKTPRLSTKETSNLLLSCTQKQKIVGSSYSSENLNLLSETNSAYDSARQTAEQTGEPYTSFDSQLNNLAASYNSQANQLYINSVKSLGTCTNTLPKPILFQPFTP